MNQNRIIIVSNRLPIHVSEKNGKYIVTQSSGGLVSSMASYLQRNDPKKGTRVGKLTQWVGCADISKSKFEELLHEKKLRNSNFELNPVYIPDKTKDKYYNGFCNNTIWPLFHYFPSYVKYDTESYRHYCLANELFYKKIMDIYQPGDLIWIHDYHLMPLAGLLRKSLPDAAIGFFLHIPFPSFELFRVLPEDWRVDILNGLLGADLIGFHTNDYMQHFLKSVQNLLGYENVLGKLIVGHRSVMVDTFPISIDFNKFNLASNKAEVFDEANAIKKRLQGQQIIISVDRLDYTKAITNRLESFELFLEKYPAYREKVSYILVVVPSRDLILKYKENKKEIEHMVSGINGKYGSVAWTPVIYQYKSLDFTKLTGLYFAADLALITPLRDGMNLVCKEFVSTRLEKRGVLILSETAGASSELTEAIIVNPADRNQIANAILNALSMPYDEQISRNESMQSRIKTYDVVKWVEDFITQLMLQKTVQEKLKVKEITQKVTEKVLMQYNKAVKRLILLDYDGTLTPIVKHPNLAAPSKDILQLIGDLANDKNNEVVLISGRSKEVLDKWFPEANFAKVAEHGGFYKAKGEGWINEAKESINWKAPVFKIMDYYLTRSPGAFIEEKELSVAWHYRNVKKELGFIRAQELYNELKNLSMHMKFNVLEGTMVIEARVRGVNKGIITKTLLQKDDYDFILAIGDDKTDEEMFEVIPSLGISIRVGLTQSLAKYNFSLQSDVPIFLKKLFTEVNSHKKEVFAS